MTISFERLKIDNLIIAPELLVRHEDALPSTCSTIVFSGAIEDVLHERYGRQGLCLKVFDSEEPTWHRTPLPESSWVQNLFAIHGFAPRVYDLVTINNSQYAQVTDYLTTPGHACPDDIYRLMFQNGIQHIKPSRCDIDANRNWSGDKLLDCGGFFLSQRQHYEKQLRLSCLTDHGTAYESVPELDIIGKRDMRHRIERMGLDAVDFAGKAVIDLGCNLGAFCRYVIDRGAHRVVGIDRYTTQPAAEIANYLGYWNIDFADLNLPRDVRFIGEQFDIVFCLSVVNHIGGYAEWIPGLLKPGGTMFFEEHGHESQDRHVAALQRNFEDVVYLGMTNDNHPRHLFRCDGVKHDTV